jgi:hypothetical protein
MSLDSLRQLVHRYAANQIDRSKFREDFVDYLSVRHEDPQVNGLVNAIESAHADLMEGYSDEAAFRHRVSALALGSELLSLNTFTFTIESQPALNIFSDGAGSLSGYPDYEPLSGTSSNPSAANQLELRVA